MIKRITAAAMAAVLIVTAPGLSFYQVLAGEVIRPKVSLPSGAGQASSANSLSSWSLPYRSDARFDSGSQLGIQPGFLGFSRTPQSQDFTQSRSRPPSGITGEAASQQLSEAALSRGNAREAASKDQKDAALSRGIAREPVPADSSQDLQEMASQLNLRTSEAGSTGVQWNRVSKPWDGLKDSLASFVPALPLASAGLPVLQAGGPAGTLIPHFAEFKGVPQIQGLSPGSPSKPGSPGPSAAESPALQEWAGRVAHEASALAFSARSRPGIPAVRQEFKTGGSLLVRAGGGTGAQFDAGGATQHPQPAGRALPLYRFIAGRSHVHYRSGLFWVKTAAAAAVAYAFFGIFTSPAAVQALPYLQGPSLLQQVVLLAGAGVWAVLGLSLLRAGAESLLYYIVAWMDSKVSDGEYYRRMREVFEGHPQADVIFGSAAEPGILGIWESPEFFKYGLTHSRGILLRKGTAALPSFLIRVILEHELEHFNENIRSSVGPSKSDFVKELSAHIFELGPLFGKRLSSLKLLPLHQALPRILDEFSLSLDRPYPPEALILPSAADSSDSVREEEGLIERISKGKAVVEEAAPEHFLSQKPAARYQYIHLRPGIGPLEAESLQRLSAAVGHVEETVLARSAPAPGVPPKPSQSRSADIRRETAARKQMIRLWKQTERSFGLKEHVCFIWAKSVYDSLHNGGLALIPLPENPDQALLLRKAFRYWRSPVGGSFEVREVNKAMGAERPALLLVKTEPFEEILIEPEQELEASVLEADKSPESQNKAKEVLIRAGIEKEFLEFVLANGGVVRDVFKDTRQAVLRLPEHLARQMKGQMFRLGISVMNSSQEYEALIYKAAYIQKAVEAWRLGFDGTGVVVAAQDTGADNEHPATKGRIAANLDATGTGLKDEPGHGTHVLGTMIAQALVRWAGGFVQLPKTVVDAVSRFFNIKSLKPSPSNLWGLARGATGVMTKVFYGDGRTSLGLIMRGANMAKDWRGPQGEKAAANNVSLGGRSSDSPLTRFYGELTRWLAVVVAAGNSGPFSSTVHDPADDHRVIAVGSATKGPRDGLPEPSHFSAVGDVFNGELGIFEAKPDILGTGGQVWSVRNKAKECFYYLVDVVESVLGPRSRDMIKSTCDVFEKIYVWMGGTSMAAPIVTAIAAILEQAVMHFTSEKALQKFLSKAQLDPKARDFYEKNRNRVLKILLMASAASMALPHHIQGAGMADAEAGVELARASFTQPKGYAWIQKTMEIEDMGRQPFIRAKEAAVEKLRSILQKDTGFNSVFSPFRKAALKVYSDSLRFEGAGSPSIRLSRLSKTLFSTSGAGPFEFSQDQQKEIEESWRLAFAQALEKEKTLPRLLEALGHEKWIIRWRAALALRNIPSPDSVEALKKAARDEDGRVRAAALQALWSIKEDSASQALKELAQDPGWDVRAYAAAGLLRRGDKSRLPLLASMAQDFNEAEADKVMGKASKYRRMLAVWNLGQGGEVSPEAAELLARKALVPSDLSQDSESYYVRHLAVAASLNLLQSSPASMPDGALVALIKASGPQEKVMSRSVFKFFLEASELDPMVLRMSAEGPVRAAMTEFVQKHKDTEEGKDSQGAVGGLVHLFANILQIPLEIPRMDPGESGDFLVLRPEGLTAEIPASKKSFITKTVFFDDSGKSSSLDQDRALKALKEYVLFPVEMVRQYGGRILSVHHPEGLIRLEAPRHQKAKIAAELKNSGFAVPGAGSETEEGPAPQVLQAPKPAPASADEKKKEQNRKLLRRFQSYKKVLQLGIRSEGGKTRPFRFHVRGGEKIEAVSPGLEGFWRTKEQIEKSGKAFEEDQMREHFFTYLIDLLEPAAKFWREEHDAEYYLDGDWKELYALAQNTYKLLDQLKKLRAGQDAPEAKNAELDRLLLPYIEELQRRKVQEDPAGWIRTARLYEIFERAHDPEGERLAHSSWARLKKGLRGLAVSLRLAKPEAPKKFFEAFGDRNFEQVRRKGFNTIYLMPFFPISTRGALGTGGGSPYAAMDYFSVHPELGTLEAAKLFFSRAHEAGFRVVIDLVLNHTGMDSRLLEERPELYVHKIPPQGYSDQVPEGWFRYNAGNYPLADGKRGSKTIWVKHGTYRWHGKLRTWDDTAQLDVSNPETWKILAEIVGFWTQAGVDGFRMDMAFQLLSSYFAENFKDYLAENKRAMPQGELLEHLIAEAKRTEPRTAFIAESYSHYRELSDIGFDAFYYKEWWDAFNQKNPDALQGILEYLEYASWQKGGAVPNPFSSNHDEAALKRAHGPLWKVAAVLSFGLLTLPTIHFAGQEIGFDRGRAARPGEDLDVGKSLPISQPVRIIHTEKDPEITPVFNQLFRQLPGLKKDLGPEPRFKALNPSGQLWRGYALVSENGKRYVVIGNFSDKEIPVDIRRPDLNIDYHGRLKPYEASILPVHPRSPLREVLKGFLSGTDGFKDAFLMAAAAVYVAGPLINRQAVQAMATYSAWAGQVPFIILPLPQIFINARNLRNGNLKGLKGVSEWPWIAGSFGNLLNMFSFVSETPMYPQIFGASYGVTTAWIVVWQLWKAGQVPTRRFAVLTVLTGMGLPVALWPILKIFAAWVAKSIGL